MRRFNAEQGDDALNKELSDMWEAINQLKASVARSILPEGFAFNEQGQVVNTATGVVVS